MTETRTPLSLWKRWIYGLGAGAVMALGSAPFDLWYLAFAGLVGAFVVFARSPDPVAAAGAGWAVGLGYFALGLNWIVEPFLVDAAATGWMAPFGLIGLAGGLGLFWALAFWGAALFGRAPMLALVITWGAAELARAFVLTGFPWALVGYLWAQSSAIQFVSVVGPHGLSVVSFALAALCAAAILHPSVRLKYGVAGGGALAVLLAGGLWLTPAPQDLGDRPIVRLIQPNAAQHEKWDPDKVGMFFDRQVAYTAALPTPGQPAPALIVWPETALPMLLSRADGALATISAAAGASEVIVGVQRHDSGRYFNALAHMEAGGQIAQVYDKHHLVPFGEYMPAAALFARWNILGLAARAEGGYSGGDGPELLDLGPLGRAVPLICYEAVFPHNIHRAPGRADLLLQITNDAWFGEWSGPYQHLAQARIRAIEQGLPMLRVANTGVSAVIDGAGRIVAALPLGEAGFVDARLPPPARVTLYSRTGDLPVLVLLISALTVLCFVGRKSD